MKKKNPGKPIFSRPFIGVKIKPYFTTSRGPNFVGERGIWTWCKFAPFLFESIEGRPEDFFKRPKILPLPGSTALSKTRQSFGPKTLPSGFFCVDYRFYLFILIFYMKTPMINHPKMAYDLRIYGDPFPKKFDIKMPMEESHHCNHDTTWNVDGVTPMYWFYHGPLIKLPFGGLRHLLSLRCNSYK